jgi:hypothetical protein
MAMRRGFFRQASEQAEDGLYASGARPLRGHPRDALRGRRIGVDAWSGMACSNLVALAVTISTAARLFCSQAACSSADRGAACAADEWCERGDSNPHDLGSVDFESTASTVPPLSRGAAFTPSCVACHRLRPGVGFAIRSAR